MNKSKFISTLVATSVISLFLNACSSSTYSNDELLKTKENHDFIYVPLEKEIGNSTTLCAFDKNFQTYKVYEQETYYNAINRWLTQNGWKKIAWNLPAQSRNKLDEMAEKEFAFSGCLITAINHLSLDLEVPFNVFLDGETGIAGIHKWSNRDVQLFYVNSTNLHDAVKTLALSYGWNWSDKEDDKSWLATDNFKILSPYPIVTLKGDLSAALSIILADYPVAARLMQGTQKLFIIDEK